MFTQITNIVTHWLELTYVFVYIHCKIKQKCCRRVINRSVFSIKEIFRTLWKWTDGSHPWLETTGLQLRLPDVLDCQELSLNLLSKRVMSLILEKHLVVLEYYPASLKILDCF